MTDQAAAVVQRWMALDLWMALGRDSLEFDAVCDSLGLQELWAQLLGSVRDESVTKRYSLTRLPSQDHWTARCHDHVRGVVRNGLNGALRWIELHDRVRPHEEEKSVLPGRGCRDSGTARVQAG